MSINNSKNQGEYRKAINNLETNLNTNKTTLTNNITTVNTNLTNSINDIKSTYKKIKRCVIGQSSSTNTNPWYRFCTVKITDTYYDWNISFKISQGYADSNKYLGILTAHIRTGSTKLVEGAHLTWEYTNAGVVRSDWVLTYKNVDGDGSYIELWCCQDTAWAQYHIDTISEFSRTNWIDKCTLYSLASAGSYASIDDLSSGYTKVTSTIGANTIINTYSSGTSWYRIWSDGWIEQGGRVTKTASSGTITFSKAFKDTNYTFVSQEGAGTNGEATGTSTDTGGYGDNLGVTNFTTTTVRYSCVATRHICWYACGD